MKTHLLAATAFVAVISSPLAAQDEETLAPENMQAIAPVLAGYTDDVLYGDVWERTELSKRDRSLVTLSALIASGKYAQVAGHTRRGLDNGLTAEEIGGLVTHMGLYTGWPNAVSSLNEIEQVFDERGIEAVSAAPAAASGGSEAQITPDVAAVAPKFAQLSDNSIEKDLWQRTDLSPRDRSLATIVALAANGDTGSLAPQVERGLANGLNVSQIGEALTHLAFYNGWPKANAALEAVAKVANAPEPSAQKLSVVPPGQDARRGPAENFAGIVTVTSPFSGTGGATIGGATVTFEPGARSNWHSHPLGQLLIVTDGEGWIQAEGETVQAMRPGDTIWTAPGVQHWHGATTDQAVTHAAISESVEGESVTRMEPVTDDEYRAP